MLNATTQAAAKDQSATAISLGMVVASCRTPPLTYCRTSLERMPISIV
jgi:hypothetical protein